MKDLIEKAKEKGYQERYKYDEDIVRMCLLQKWLRDGHSIHIVVIKNYALRTENYEGAWYTEDLEQNRGNIVEKETYEQALEEALTKALELI